MKNIIHITDNNKHKIMADSGFIQGSTNESSRERMKKFFQWLFWMNWPKDRESVSLITISTEKQKEIAENLGIDSSTVSRHIIKARDKLRHIASYYVN